MGHGNCQLSFATNYMTTYETSGYYHFKVIVYETITATEETHLSATLAYGVE